MKDLRNKKSRPNNIDIIVANNLRNRRQYLGLAQQELATTLGVTIQQVQKYEQGANRISSGNLFILAQILQVPVSYFFYASLEPEPELWINEEKILTIRGGSLNITVNGMSLDKLKYQGDKAR